jgi:signal transduction histidine kinase
VERQPDGGARILVRDTGVGIRPEDIPRAFEPFVQLDNAPAGVQRDWPRSGTGLGLPIARGLVEAHGGVLTVESAPGHGTTVAVTLPPERVRATSQGQARVAPHLPGSAEKARPPS